MKQHKRPIFTVIIILLLLIISCRKTTAPSEHGPYMLWSRTYGGSSNDEGESVQQTFDGGYIITGWTQSFGNGSSDVYLIKTDAYGNPRWTRTYGGSSGDAAYSVQQASDGGYIIAGLTHSFGDGNNDVYLIKTDVNGDTVWTKTYGGSNSDVGWSVQQTSDGGYIIIGETESLGAGQKDVYFIKTDSHGNTIWTRTYGGEDGDSGHSIQQTSDEGYIIVGSTYSYGSGPIDVYLIKTDENGDTLWTKTYGGDNSDVGYSVQQTSNGGYIIAGVTESFGEGGLDVYIIKTDAGGDTLWTKTCGGADWDFGFSVQLTSECGYIVVGKTVSFGAGSFDVYVIKIKE
ncbi:hypothetical protein ES703_10766 [subsurface metagenome]